MRKKFSARELSIMDDFAKEVLPVIITENIKSEGAENWPDIFTDYAETAYNIAAAMLARRKELTGQE